MTRIGFVGAGQMAQALAGGISASDTKASFLVADPSTDAIAAFRERTQGTEVEVAASNPELFGAADVVFLAVKPQYFEAAVDTAAIRSSISESQTPLVVSIMAGISIAKIQQQTSIETVIRVMPNTPCLIGKGIVAIATDPALSQEDIDNAKHMIATVGQTVMVTEAQLDAVTGLSGSGPAFVYRFIQSLIDGGVEQGLAPEIATRLTVQTVLGAASMVLETGESCQSLIDQVTSPGGTTLAGLAALEQRNFVETVRSAVTDATARSVELGKA